MTLEPGAPRPPRIRLEDVICKTIAGIVLITAPWSSVQVAAKMGSRTGDASFPDFSALFLAGRLAAENRLAEAYSWPTMATLEKAEGLRDSDLMPFAYPPPFAFAMAGLAHLPGWLAYAVFVLIGLALFVAVVWRMSGDLTWPLVAALAPTVWINVVVGQNGLLFTGLAGLSTALVIRRQTTAGGAVAGLIGVMKPQVAVVLPLIFLTRREWRALAVSAIVGATVLGLSILICGLQIVPDFLDSLSENSRALASKRFPLHRMMSVYAFLRSFGVSSNTALALHAAAAAAVLWAVWSTARRFVDVRTEAGLALMTASFVSPYFYDYDGAVTGLGLALVLPTLARFGAPWRTTLPLAAFGLATASGIVQGDWAVHRSIGAPLLLVCLASALWSLTAERRVTPTPRTAAVS